MKLSKNAHNQHLHTVGDEQILSPGASIIAVHLNVPYGDVVTPEDVIISLRSGEFQAATKKASNLLVSLFIEVEPELILRCAREIQAPLEKVNHLYQRSLECGFYHSRAWEHIISTLL